MLQPFYFILFYCNFVLLCFILFILFSLLFDISFRLMLVFGWHYIALYCIVLHCIALYCIVLYCIVLHCIALYCIVLKFNSSRLPGSCLKDWNLYSIALHFLHCIVLYCIVLNCIVLKFHCSRLPRSCLKVPVWVWWVVLNQVPCYPNLG